MIETPLIELSDLVKRYLHGDHDVRALDGVSFAIERGEFVAIMGPSGSGKSTCMNILGCLDAPTSGRYRLGGMEVQTMNSEQRALVRRDHIGFVFQGFHLLPRTTALENVELPLLYQNVARRDRTRRAALALERVGLAQRLEHRPAELSGGQQQRVAIARAIVTAPSLLLADEPTGNLDSQRGAEIMDLLEGLNRDKGITIVMVTHDRDIAARAARCIDFQDGRVRSDVRTRRGS